jgi:hypothetical protein
MNPTDDGNFPVQNAPAHSEEKPVIRGIHPHPRKQKVRDDRDQGQKQRTSQQRSRWN